MFSARGTAVVSVQRWPATFSQAKSKCRPFSHRSDCMMACSVTRRNVSSNARPILLFDVMDTIVKDPFYEHMPVHFDMTFKELLAAKHPTTWIDFEKGHLTEEQALAQFFADGRIVDGEGLKGMLVERYEFLPGMPELLQKLQAQGHEMHVISNYPEWYSLIEEKLKISQYLPWTFISCVGPMKGFRKPDRAAYDVVCQHLAIDPSQAVIIDDRKANIDAALEHGMRGVHMSNAKNLIEELRRLEIDF
eukprot:jgi/Ulvmu1/7177/UM034_0086.1